jgi:hypothetical protein
MNSASVSAQERGGWRTKDSVHIRELPHAVLKACPRFEECCINPVEVTAVKDLSNCMHCEDNLDNYEKNKVICEDIGEQTLQSLSWGNEIIVYD